MSSTADNDDVISSLPDAILCHILSFLPTTESVATSVLSKRWTDLWRSVPTLNLIDVELDDQEAYFRFNQLVNSVLLAHNIQIKSSILDIWYDEPDFGHLGFPNVIKWIKAVVQRGVERLEIRAHMRVFDFDELIDLADFPVRTHEVDFPVSIFSCKTLVVLNLYGLFVTCFTSVGLPSLKILRLEDCIFLNARDVLRLLVGCPNLEELYAFRLQFYTPGETLSYQDCESLDLRKLTIACMPCTFCHFPLKALHNVKELHIEINQVYQSSDEIPTFRNLTKLKLHSINSNWDLLVQVLNHCPNLQNLELDEDTADGIREDVQKNWVDPELVPQCLSNLKTCKFQNFLGQQGELMSARYILKNARVLQTMIICGGQGLNIERELSLCPRASPTCELTSELILNASRLSEYQFL